jgi:large subunit ribosomal protein L5
MAKNSESNPGGAGGAGAVGASAGGAGAASGAKAKPGKASSAAPAKGGGSSKGSGGAKTSGASSQAGEAAAKSAAGGAAGERRQKQKAYVPRLRHRYLEDVVPKLKKEFGIENTMAVPRLERISLNMGMGEAIQNIKILDDAVEEMAALAGQRPTVTRAQKSIAAFKLRAGMPIGCRVTLRGERMWDFLDRFISVALPRVRDFRGVSPKSFDGRGNYTMGIRDHLIFLEIDYNKVERPKGMNITIVTTAGNDERALYLLRELGMPFAR